MNKRLNYIDITRGIAIIFIVLGHALNRSINSIFFTKFLYSFHVVLFFIISGYVFKIKDNESFRQFVKKKFFRIIIPYFFWETLFLIPYFMLGQSVGDALSVKSSFNFNTQIFNIIYGVGAESALRQNSALWFLPALFSMEVIYYFIIKNTKDSKFKQLLWLFISIVTAYISSFLLKIYLPFGINTVLNLGVCFYIGYLLNEKSFFISKNIFSNIKVMIIIFIIGILAVYFNKEIVNCIEYKYGNFTLALLSGICLSINIIYLAVNIEKNKFIEFLGKSTLGILIFHKLTLLVIQTKLGIFSSLLANSNFFIEITIGIIATVLSILFSIIAAEMVKKISPILLGEINKNI